MRFRRPEKVGVSLWLEDMTEVSQCLSFVASHSPEVLLSIDAPNTCENHQTKILHITQNRSSAKRNDEDETHGERLIRRCLNGSVVAAFSNDITRSDTGVQCSMNNDDHLNQGLPTGCISDLRYPANVLIKSCRVYHASQGSR